MQNVFEYEMSPQVHMFEHLVPSSAIVFRVVEPLGDGASLEEMSLGVGLEVI